MSIHNSSGKYCKLEFFDGSVLIGYLHAALVAECALILNFSPIHRSYTTEQGKQMLEAALDVFRSLGCHYAMYLPSRPNSDLILLFKDLGFRTDAYYRDTLSRSLD